MISSMMAEVISPKPAKKAAVVQVITYASPSFMGSASVLGQKSIQNGFDAFEIFHYDRLQISFRSDHQSTLSKSRGAGYWIWKPRIILDKLESIDEGDYLFYIDAGALPRKKCDEIMKLCHPDKINVWEIKNGKIRNWTDANVALQLELSDDILNSPMIWAGGICIPSNQDSIEIMSKWMELCENQNLLHPDSAPNYSPTENIFWHRHDQSLLSILVAQNPEKFMVHAFNYKGFNQLDCFDLHRNLRIKNINMIFTFPKIRLFRQKIVSSLPTWLRRNIRSWFMQQQAKNLAVEEINSLKSFF
jgi:hypothetical protein